MSVGYAVDARIHQAVAVLDIINGWDPAAPTDLIRRSPRARVAERDRVQFSRRNFTASPRNSGRAWPAPACTIIRDFPDEGLRHRQNSPEWIGTHCLRGPVRPAAVEVVAGQTGPNQGAYATEYKRRG